MLSLTYTAGSNTMVIHPVVIYDNNQTVLVDTGMPGSRDSILNQINQAGISDRALDTIILTHQDIDHIGGLPEFLLETDVRPRVIAHEDDAPYIEGVRPLIKMTPERRELLLGSLPTQKSEQFERVFSADSEANISLCVKDGQILPVAGGLKVIHTPGHTPGHLSLYHLPSQTLIAGDAMVIQEGKLQGPNPVMTPDMNTALESLVKFKNLPVQNIICYHGGLLNQDVEAQISKLTSR